MEMNLSSPIGQSQALSAALLWVGSIFIVLCSLSLQHLFGYEPCKLCYVQREVHYALVLLGGLLVLSVWRDWPALVVRLCFLLILAAILYGAGVGVYQAGAEWQFWMGPNDCTNSVTITNDASNLLSQLQTTELISCTVPHIRILGLSFAGWNVVLSCCLALIALAGAFMQKDSFLVLLYRIPFVEKLVGSILEKAANVLHKN